MLILNLRNLSTTRGSVNKQRQEKKDQKQTKKRQKTENRPKKSDQAKSAKGKNSPFQG